MKPLTKPELRILAKLIMIPVYLLSLYLASYILQEATSIFDYGRF